MVPIPPNADFDEHLGYRYYDLMAVVGYNDDPPVKGLGSAIFFHVTPDYGPTAGCIALSLQNLTWVLERAGTETMMEIS
jgi:L,D-peptidoglycan transpeptidase YkuD (ErfK/YbiS/YcfS/YnhG family)